MPVELVVFLVLASIAAALWPRSARAEEPADAPDGLGFGPAPESPGTQTPEVESFLSPDSDAPAPSDGAPSPEPGPADAFDWSAVSLRRTNPQDVPESYRPAFEKLQKEFKDVQGDRDREREDLQRREQALIQRQQEWLNQQQTRQIQPQQVSPADQTPAQRKRTVAQLQEAIDNPQTDPGDRAAYMTLKNIYTDLETEIDTRVKKALEPYQPIQERFGQIEQAVTGLTQQQQQQQRQAIASEIQAAISAHGETEINAYTQQITGILGLEFGPDGGLMRTRAPWKNPATGKPFTASEAYEWASGKTAAKATAMRQQDRQVKGDSKKAAAGANGLSGQPKGNLSEAELLEEIGKIPGLVRG